MSKPSRVGVPEDLLRTDATDLADRLMKGESFEVLEVVYSGSYSRPHDMAALLRYAAGLLQFRGNQQPGAAV